MLRSCSSCEFMRSSVWLTALSSGARWHMRPSEGRCSFSASSDISPRLYFVRITSRALLRAMAISQGLKL